MTDEPVTEEYLAEWSRDRQRDKGPHVYDHCAYCAPHGWHGLPCTGWGQRGPGTCPCPGKTTS